MRVMAIGAHPDDVEFMCAGTLFLLSEKGFDIHTTAVAAGDCGSAEYSPEEIMTIRRREAEEAARTLGAGYSCLDVRDCRIFAGEVLMETLVEEMRRVAPDVVFTHFPRDYMVDHEETSRIVRSAAFTASMPNFHTGADEPASPLEHTPHLYYWAPMEGIDILGNRVASAFYVNTERVMDKKAEMLACHKSQRDWLLRQHGVDEYINTMREVARQAGEVAGVLYAEGFTQHLGHAYPRENLLAQHVPVIEP